MSVLLNSETGVVLVTFSARLEFRPCLTRARCESRTCCPDLVCCLLCVYACVYVCVCVFSQRQSCRSVWCSARSSESWRVVQECGGSTRRRSCTAEGVPQPPEPLSGNTQTWRKLLLTSVNTRHYKHLYHRSIFSQVEMFLLHIQLVTTMSLNYTRFKVEIHDDWHPSMHSKDTQTFLLAVFGSFSSSSLFSFSQSFGEMLSWSWSPLSSSLRLQYKFRPAV